MEIPEGQDLAPSKLPLYKRLNVPLFATEEAFEEAARKSGVGHPVDYGSEVIPYQVKWAEQIEKAGRDIKDNKPVDPSLLDLEMGNLIGEAVQLPDRSLDPEAFNKLGPAIKKYYSELLLAQKIESRLRSELEVARPKAEPVPQTQAELPKNETQVSKDGGKEVLGNMMAEIQKEMDKRVARIAAGDVIIINETKKSIYDEKDDLDDLEDQMDYISERMESTPPGPERNELKEKESRLQLLFHSKMDGITRLESYLSNAANELFLKSNGCW